MNNSLPSPRSAAEFLERVRCLAALFDCSVTSSLRTDARNAKVGGSPTSWHRIARGGLGADLVPDVFARLEEVCAAGRRLGLDMVNEGDHAHAEPSS